MTAPGRDGHKDYSATPLWRKLGVVAGGSLRVEAAPSGFLDLLDLPQGVRLSGDEAAVIVVFSTDPVALDRRFERLVDALAERGGLWVCWPKKTSRLPSALDFDAVQRVGLARGLVDNKSCRIDDDWQALRFVRRLPARQG